MAKFNARWAFYSPELLKFLQKNLFYCITIPSRVIFMKMLCNYAILNEILLYISHNKCVNIRKWSLYAGYKWRKYARPSTERSQFWFVQFTTRFTVWRMATSVLDVRWRGSECYFFFAWFLQCTYTSYFQFANYYHII